MTVRPSVVLPKRARSSSRRWVVRTGDDRSLLSLIERLGEDRAALGQGRVFVNGRRVQSPATAVALGDCIEVSSRGAVAQAIRLMERRGGILIVHKPPGVPTEPDRSGSDTSLVEQAARLLGRRPGSVHACSRLDVGVSGLVLVTTSSEARRHMEALRRRRVWSKSYFAVASGTPEADGGLWSWPLERNGRVQRAITAFQVLCRAPESTVSSGRERRAARPTLLRLLPQTGRWHQLRLHAAHAGIPLLGDRRHDGPERLCSADGVVHLAPRVALDAAQLDLVDERGHPWRVRATCPPDLRDLWLELGGPAGALDVWLPDSP